MTRRDRYILTVVAAVVLLGAYWLLALGPKRDKLAKLDKDLTSARQSLTQSQQEKTQFAQAQVQFPALYARLGRIGKAVPADEEVPSLLVQLNHSAAKANVDFRSIALKLDLADRLVPPTAGASASSAATGATGATGASGSSAGATATASPGTATPAAGAATPAATGAASGTLQPLPFEYKFSGNFYSLENLIHNVTGLVEKHNREVAISGRLVVIQGFAMARTKVTLLATTYMLPADQGLFGGATAAGPAGVTGATAQPASASTTGTPTPPTAAVTTP